MQGRRNLRKMLKKREGIKKYFLFPLKIRLNVAQCCKFVSIALFAGLSSLFFCIFGLFAMSDSKIYYCRKYKNVDLHTFSTFFFKLNYSIN